MTQTILITGASAGIGAATARKFLDEGWNVALVARRQAPLEVTAKGHANALAIAADVTDADAVQSAFDAALKRFGRLDTLFNNAGTFGPAGPIDEVDPDEFRKTVDVNITGMFLCARAAFGQMRRQSPQGGRIINNGSISAHAPRPGSVAYTTTKHAITGLTKTLSLDGRPYDIACGQIDIGNARTDLLEGVIAKGRAADPKFVPPPTMDVVQVADAVLHMANFPSEANVQFMTIMATKMPFIGRG